MIYITKYKDKPSIVSDTMFKTMFQTEKRIKYSAYSLLTKLKYEELLRNMKLITNELTKKRRNAKGERSDFVAKINGAYINIEVNNNKDIKTYERNLGYVFKLYYQNISGEEYDFNMVFQINFNNFAYKESKKIIDVFYIRNKEGIVLTKKIVIINVVLPNLLEKCYTKGIESLTELEKYTYSLVERDIEKLDKIMKKVAIVREYIEEAKEVIKEPIFGEAYDYEKASNEQWYQDGIEQGIKQGEEKTKIDMIKSLFKNGATLNLISKSTNLSIKQVKEILNVK